MLSKLIKFIDVVNLPNRINRIKHFALIGFNFTLYFFIALIIQSFIPVSPNILKILMYIIALLYICNILQLKIKRLHDFNCSGWFVLLMFVPILGWIWGLLIFVIPGSKGDNKFGTMPDKANTLENLIALLWIPALLLIIYCFALMLH